MTSRSVPATGESRNVVDWFDPTDQAHLAAWKHLSDKGSWPVGFIPEGTRFPTMWQSQLAFRMADKWVAYASSEKTAISPELRVAAGNAANKLSSLGRTFSSTNFTDRYGDGPHCLDLARKLMEALNGK